MNFTLRYFVAGLLLLAAHEIDAQHSVDASTSRPSPAIPFHLERGFLICVEGRIGTLTRLKFILDTGATHTMVDTRIVDRLALPRQKGKVLNFDKSVKVEWIDLPDLQVGPVYARNLDVMVGNLKEFSEFAQDLDAIIGLDLLRTTHILGIDYRNSVVTFGASSEAQAANSSIPQILSVRVAIQGQTMRLIVDTGLEGILLYTDRLRKHQPRILLSDKPVPAHAGRLVGEKATLSGIRLGPNELRTSVVLIRRAPDALAADIDGYLGTNTLHAQTIEFNFETAIMRWQ